MSLDSELVKQLSNLQKQVDGLVRPEVSPLVLGPFLDLPGKVGIWYAGDVQRSTGNIYDASEQGRTLTYNGNPTFNQLSNGLAYADLDGTGDFFSRTDETDLDVLGTETIYAAGVRGLTLGGWFWLNALASSRGLISKYSTAANQRGYMLYYNFGSTTLEFIVSTDGINTVTVQVGSDPSTGIWIFIVGRFIPSTSLKLYTNQSSYTQTVGVPASIFNNSAALQIGAFNAGANNLNGRFAIAFLCANALPDAMISSLFQRTRGLFGV